MRGRTFWWVLVSVVAVGAALGFLGSRPHTIRLAYAAGVPRPYSQQAGSRSFQKATFTRLASVLAGEGRALQAPTVLRIDGEGNLYVVDSRDHRVKKFSSAGEPLMVFGAEDLQNPSDVALAPGGEVWVVDPNPRKILVFSAGGTVARRISFDRLVWRLVLDNRGGFVATLPSGASTLFQRYSRTGGAEHQFGTLFPPDLQNALTLDGWMVGSGGGGFIYVFAHEGLLASYSPEGALRYLRATIEAPPLPQIKVDAAGGQTFGPEAPRVTISGSLSGPDLYVLATGPGQRRVLDVYDAASGSYRYSLEPPDPESRYVTISPGRLYSASRSQVTIWETHLDSNPGTSPATLAVLDLAPGKE